MVDAGCSLWLPNAGQQALQMLNVLQETRQGGSNWARTGTWSLFGSCCASPLQACPLRQSVTHIAEIEEQLTSLK